MKNKIKRNMCNAVDNLLFTASVLAVVCTITVIFMKNPNEDFQEDEVYQQKNRETFHDMK